MAKIKLTESQLKRMIQYKIENIKENHREFDDLGDTYESFEEDYNDGDYSDDNYDNDDNDYDGDEFGGDGDSDEQNRRERILGIKPTQDEYHEEENYDMKYQLSEEDITRIVEKVLKNL
jgi:hypothetical protein